MSGIRLGDIPDMGAIVELGRELLEQSVYNDCREDEQKFRITVASMMGSKTSRVLLVVDDDDKPQGFLLGLVDELFFSRDRYATDLALYVRKGFRHLVPRLIREFKIWAATKPRVKHIMLGVSSGIGDVKRVGRMYQDLGLTQVGGIYFQRV